MNNKSLIALFAVIALVGGVIGGYAINKFSALGGDFAGGITPSQLVTATPSTNALTPVGNFSYAFGGAAAANEITSVYTAVVNYPAAALTIPSGASPSSSATTTKVAYSAAGFSIGDPCQIQYNFTTSTLLVSANVSAVSGSAVTTTITILNTTGATIPATVTSTVTGVSSTIKATCYHTGV